MYTGFVFIIRIWTAGLDIIFLTNEFFIYVINGKVASTFSFNQKYGCESDTEIEL